MNENRQNRRIEYSSNPAIGSSWNNRHSCNSYNLYASTGPTTGAPPPQQQQAYSPMVFKPYAAGQQQASTVNINYNHNRNGLYQQPQSRHVHSNEYTNNYGSGNYHYSHNHNGSHIPDNRFDGNHNHNHNHNNNHNSARSWSNNSGYPRNISNLNQDRQSGAYKPSHGSSYAVAQLRHNPLLAQYEEILNGIFNTSTKIIHMFDHDTNDNKGNGDDEDNVVPISLASINAVPIELGFLDKCLRRTKDKDKKEEIGLGQTVAIKEALQVTHGALLDVAANYTKAMADNLKKDQEMKDLQDRLAKSEEALEKFEAARKAVIKVKNPLVMIIGIEKYNGDKKGLECTRTDARRIKDLFAKTYKYRYVEHHNTNGAKGVHNYGKQWEVNRSDAINFMTNMRRRYLESDKHSDIDGVIVYISGHGYDNYVASTDDAKINLTEIGQIFNNASCHRIHAAKPRILVVDSCRGDKQCEYNGHESDETLEGDDEATGYSAHYDGKRGSDYTNIFCDELEAKKDEGLILSTMGHHINDKLIAKHKIQTSEIYSTLTRDVMLIPNI